LNIQKRKYNLRILDGLRGLAALYVMLGHARWLLWEGFSAGYARHPEAYGPLNRISVYVSSAFIFGHEAVLFFFVLSGFVIHLRYARDIKAKGQKATFGWADFFYRRAKRLYPTLVVAMVLTLLFDLTGEAQQYLIYTNNTPYSLINQIGVDHGWMTALGNLAFVMPTYAPVWGTNGPLWSLQYEWWFYMIYPVFWWVSY
jgi:peptidoglycan/LPS O-acetylase OafA/YrhL